MAALISMADLKLLDHDETTPQKPRGTLALVGAWREAPDSEIDAFIEDVYKARENDALRPVHLEL